MVGSAPLRLATSIPPEAVERSLRSRGGKLPSLSGLCDPYFSGIFLTRSVFPGKRIATSTGILTNLLPIDIPAEI
jgi:hypothetical protein